MQKTIVIPLSEYQKLQLVLSDRDQLLLKHQQLMLDHQKLLSDHQQLALKVSGLEAQVQKVLGDNEKFSLENEALKEKALFLRDKLFGKKKDNVKGKDRDLNKIKINKEPQKRGRKPIDEGYKADEVRRYDFAEKAKCSDCQLEMHYVGDSESHHEDYQVCFKKVKICQAKYACRRCNKIIMARGSKLPIDKGLPLPGLLTQVILDKFSSATPFYRQAQNYDYMDINYSRQQLCNWLSRTADLVEPLYNLIFKEIENSNYLAADETTLPLLNIKDKEPGSKGHMCIIKQGGKGIFNFVYCWAIDARTQVAIEKKLSKFEGKLQTDGLNFYFKILGKDVVIYVACWSHVRRKFTDILKVSGKPEGVAFEVAQMIDKLYNIEHRGADLIKEELLKLRKEEATPILNQLKKYLTDILATTAPRGSLGTAIKYTVDRFDGLMEYTKDANLEIDNNATERCIKQVVIGRKNWLFADNINSAGKLAMVYSLIVTCKINNVNPREYLEYILTQLPYINKHDVAELRKLLPDKYDITKRYDLEYRKTSGIVETISIVEDIMAKGVPKAA